MWFNPSTLLIQEIVLPGSTGRLRKIKPGYARTSGYTSALVILDIGARPHQRWDLPDAQAAPPEIDQQLQQAQAQLETAQANFNLAQGVTIADRQRFFCGRANSRSR